MDKYSMHTIVLIECHYPGKLVMEIAYQKKGIFLRCS